MIDVASSPRSEPRRWPASTWAWPIALAIGVLLGLILALVRDGWVDLIGAGLLVTPIVVAAINPARKVSRSAARSHPNRL